MTLAAITHSGSAHRELRLDTAAGEATFALAQTYPNKPIRIVVPYAAGGPIDMTTRPLAQKLNEAMSNPDVKSFTQSQGAEAVSSTPEELAAMHKREYDRWGRRGEGRRRQARIEHESRSSSRAVK